MQILPAGDRALLVECDDLAGALAASAALGEARLDGVVELVPGARTVLVRLGPGVGGLTRLEHGIRRVLGAGAGGSAGAAVVAGAALAASRGRAGGGAPGREREAARAVRIPVVYDGEDLAAVAEAWGCSIDEVVRRHSETEWVCAFVGFAPGFPYLVPADPGSLPAVPRRATSRPRVPAGAVALAADYCGVYPRESPGGWQLIGRTDAVLWDARRASPALVTAGTRVRFVAGAAGDVDAAASSTDTATATATATGRTSSQESRDPQPENTGATRPPGTSFPEKCDASGPGDAVTDGTQQPRRVLQVLDPGALTLVHDLGRPGLSRLGVGASGAFDRAAHRLANRLVGNDEGAAGLEVLLGGARFALPEGAWVAVTGAEGAVTLDGQPVPRAHAVRAGRAGAELHLGPARLGLRYSVAVRGGLEVPAELGSRSRDTLAALGPAALAAGNAITLGNAIDGPVPAIDLVAVDAPPTSPTELTLRPGSRHDWFTDAAWERMLLTGWTVSSRADRTGVRLEGATLERRTETQGLELPSEGMLPGALQVSPDGVPTILGPDHPVTGGYPVIAVVTDDARDRLAQLRPGDPVRLRLATGRP